MTRNAEHIYTDRADIARLEARIAELSNDAHVELALDDGSVMRGTVAARPTVQVFYDAAGNEGLNALVRLEDPALDHPETASVYDVWIDRIVTITHLMPR